MRVGMTGARTPRTPVQLAEARTLLERLRGEGATEFHHGDCVGADAQLAEIARGLGLVIVSHPPVIADFRAFTQADVEMPAKDYHARNRAIVNATDFLLVLPNGPEQLRSGTWSTARFARSSGKYGMIIYPNGETEDL